MENIRSFYAHWWNKQRFSIDKYTEQVFLFFQDLKKFNEIYDSNWYLGDKSKTEALKYNVVLTKSTIKNLLEDGKVNMPNGEILCYRIGFWNGAPNNADSMSISITLGVIDKRQPPNSCVIGVAYSQKQQQLYQNKDIRNRLTDLLKKHWQPEFIKIRILDTETKQDHVEEIKL